MSAPNAAETEKAEARRPSRRDRPWQKRVGLALVGVLVLLLLAAWWLLGSTAGARFALARVHGLTDGAISVQRVDGRLLGTLDLAGVRYDDGQGFRLDIATASIALRAWPLLDAHLWVRQLQADGIVVQLPQQPAADAGDRGGFSLAPPLDISIDQAHLGALQIARGADTLFASDSLDLSGSWTHRGIDVKHLDLRAPDGSAKLNGNLQTTDGYRGAAKGSFAWTLGDTRYAGALVANSDGRRAKLDLNLSLPLRAQLKVDAALSGERAWTAKLDAPRFDPAPLVGTGSLISAAVALQAHGDHRAGTITGRIDLNDHPLLLQPLRASFADGFSVLRLDELVLTSPDQQGQLEASGELQLDANPLHARLALRWSDVLLPADLVGQTLASNGSLDASGSTAAWQASAAMAIGPPGKPGKLTLQLDGKPDSIAVRTLKLQQARGSLAAQGTLDLQPILAWQAQASAQRFDPGQLFVGWPGALDFALTSRGSLPAAGSDVSVDIRQLDGSLRGHALRGSGRLHLSPAVVLDGQLAIASGHSTLHISGQPGNGNRIAVALDVASLGDWLPDASGKMDGHFSLAGRWPALSVNGQLHGKALDWRQQRVDDLHLIVGLPDLTRIAGKLDLRTAGVHVQGLTFQQADVLAEGSPRDHRLAVTLRGTQLSADLALHGALQSNNHWAGSLSTLQLEPQGLPAWQLQHPAELAWQRGALSLSELCLTAGEPSLCVSAERGRTGALEASYRLHALPLALLLNAAGQAGLPLRVDGALDGSGQIQRSASGALSGQAAITSSAGSITYLDQPDEPLLRYAQLALKADLGAGEQRFQAHAALDDGGRLDGQVTLSGADHALAGQLDLRLDNLRFIELLDDNLANVQGRFAGNFQLSGTTAEPALSGHAGVEDFAGEVPALGLKLTQGTLALDADGSAQPMRLTGSVHSGEGNLAINGNIALGPTLALDLSADGSKLTAVDIPAAKVVVSPALKIDKDAAGLRITGSVAIDSAELDVDKLPGAGATQASADIVIVDQPSSAEAASKLPINVRVKIDLGRHTHLVAKGLDGQISGVLTVSERPGHATTGEGQISVDGTYKAYGQDLHIKHGLLLFASTPISNPGLNIRAVRGLNPNATIDEGQEVGLLITGTAQRPALTVFSNPVMEQSDALSYLVTGKPLSSVSSGEGDVVNDAAQALGSAAGNLLAKRVGAELGIDDIGVSNSAALGGNSAFTVGKFLSPRLYLSYGIGLFEPGEVITLRYRLSQRWNLEAQQATDFSRASLNYRIEK